jgi:Na+/H+ antiporter NhaD/arsenite permease-like protein
MIVFQMSKGDTWKLVLVLCIFTAFVSSLLDNVTTMLLVAPVTLRLCEVLEISPINVILLEVMFSNIGGTSTPIGDPPNIIVVSNPDVQADGSANFLSFTIHMAPDVVLSMIVCFIYAKVCSLFFFFFRKLFHIVFHEFNSHLYLYVLTLY